MAGRDPHPREPAREGPQTIDWIDLVALSAILAASTFFLIKLATQQFDFFDMSAFLDAGYRVYIGQEPYVDFDFNAGPVHPYIHAVFFRLFGFTKTAVLAHMSVINAVVVAITFIIARKYLSRLWTIFVTSICGICFYGTIAHPWYDQNAQFWLMLGVASLELQWPFKTDRSAYTGAFVCGLLVALSFFTKANIGVAGGLMFMAVLTLCEHRFKVIGVYIGGGLTGAALVLLTLQAPAEMLYQSFFAYRVGDRLLQWTTLQLTLRSTPYAYLILGILGLAALGGCAYIRQHRFHFVLLSGLVVTSVFTTWTGSMLKSANIGLVGVELMYLIILAYQLPRGHVLSGKRRICDTARIVLLMLAAYIVHFGLTNTLAAWSWRRSNLDNRYVLSTNSFRGWRSNQDLGEGVDRSVQVINELVPKNASLFVFPDATFIYGLTGRESYAPAPFIFHINQFPSPGRRYNAFTTRFRANPPEWILIHNQTEIAFFRTDALLRWLGLMDFVSQRYTVRWRWGDWALLHWKRDE